MLKSGSVSKESELDSEEPDAGRTGRARPRPRRPEEVVAEEEPQRVVAWAAGRGLRDGGRGQPMDRAPPEVVQPGKERSGPVLPEAGGWAGLSPRV